MKRLYIACLALLLLTGCTETIYPETEPILPETLAAAETAEIPETTVPLPQEPRAPEGMGFVSSNILQGGHLAGDGEGWIYYRQENLPGEAPSLWKAGEDGSDAVQLTEDAPESINVLDGWVYYLLSDSGWIVRVRTDGTDRQVLLEQPCSLLHAADTGLYFHRWDSDGKWADVMHMAPDGSTSTVLLEKTELLAYYDRTAYVYDQWNGSLLAYDLTAGESTELHSTFSFGHACLADADGLYYFGTETWSFEPFLFHNRKGKHWERSTDFPFLTVWQDKPLGISVSETGSSMLIQAPGVLQWRDTETTVLAALSAKPYDASGQWTDDPAGYREQMGIPYLVGDRLYLYGTRLRESLTEHGQLACIAILQNDTVVFWH